jgi:hypothetical protein
LLFFGLMIFTHFRRRITQSQDVATRGNLYTRPHEQTDAFAPGSTRQRGQ